MPTDGAAAYVCKYVISKIQHCLTNQYGNWQVGVFFSAKSFYSVPSIKLSADCAAEHFCMQVFAKQQHRLTDQDESWHVFLFLLREDLYAIPFVVSFHLMAQQYLIVCM